ncbi:hypothetical protein MPTK2_7g00060 [Marchantia polymorpha subsp. ruderalis]
MALALRIQVPLAVSRRYPLGEGVVFPRSTRLSNWRCKTLRAIRCSTADAGESSDQVGVPDKTSKPKQAQIVVRVESVNGEDYAGWTPLDNENKSNRLTGLLQIGAGLLLAVGFAVVTYTAYARKGNKHAVVYSVTTHQEQKTQLSSTTSNDSEDVDKASKFTTSSPPSSDESMTEVQGENPQPVVDSESDLHQKKTSPAAQATPGSIVVPATVDHEQEQALAALQALKVIEQGVEVGGLCTRREYARWLIASTSTLARSPAHKVFPAMYIENSSELAFNDVSPDDPDFPFIQGLAEAGLISSNLSRHDGNEETRSTDGAVFLPDSPVSRQDLVSWKLALEKNNLGSIDKQILKAQSGFIDIERISEDALPFLAADLAAGERSIAATAFGFTRRFQPDKPVTRGQAAIALVTGEAADAVAEEITRLEAEQMAEAAVVAEFALEARAQKQVEEYFNTELKLEKETRLSAIRQLEEVRDELEKMMQEREDEHKALEKMKNAMEAERALLMKFREDAEEQLQTLTAYRVEVGIEKDRFENLRREAEEEERTLHELKTEVEVEKKALTLARAWAEEEAKAARAHAKVLEEARKRWEGQGIQVHVDKELDEENIPALPWQYSGPKSSLNKFLQRAPVQDFLARAGDLKSRVLERFFQLLEAIGRAFSSAQRETAESLRGVRTKVHAVQQETVAVVSKTAQDMQEATKNTFGGLSTSISENTKKIADGCRGEAQKLAQKFKS